MKSYITKSLKDTIILSLIAVSFLPIAAVAGHKEARSFAKKYLRKLANGEEIRLF